MANLRTKKRHSRHNKSKPKSKSHSKSRSKKGGFGGWDRQTLVGAPWNPPTNNTYNEMTSPQATANHFRVSPNGVLVGGIQPAVPEMYGPGIHQTNTLVPRLPIGALGSKGGNRRQKRSLKHINKRGKRGGFTFGGFPQLIGTAWDNTVNGVKNTFNAYKGVELLPSASPWVQPELSKDYVPPIPKPVDLTALKQAAAQRVANV